MKSYPYKAYTIIQEKRQNEQSSCLLPCFSHFIKKAGGIRKKKKAPCKELSTAAFSISSPAMHPLTLQPTTNWLLPAAPWHPTTWTPSRACKHKHVSKINSSSSHIENASLFSLAKGHLLPVQSRNPYHLSNFCCFSL